MSEERLKEIKDSIDLQKEVLIAHNMGTLCIDEELELYNEVIRLREIIEILNKTVEQYELIIGYYDGNYDGYEDTYSHNTLKDDFLDILKENKNENNNI